MQFDDFFGNEKGPSEWTRQSIWCNFLQRGDDDDEDYDELTSPVWSDHHQSRRQHPSVNEGDSEGMVLSIVKGDLCVKIRSPSACERFLLRPLRRQLLTTVDRLLILEKENRDNTISCRRNCLRLSRIMARLYEEFCRAFPQGSLLWTTTSSDSNTHRFIDYCCSSSSFTADGDDQIEKSPADRLKVRRCLEELQCWCNEPCRVIGGGGGGGGGNVGELASCWRNKKKLQDVNNNGIDKIQHSDLSSNVYEDEKTVGSFGEFKKPTIGKTNHELKLNLPKEDNRTSTSNSGNPTPTLYKTELCRYNAFRPGFCHAGDACTYAHGRDELRSRPSDDKVGITDRPSLSFARRRGLCFQWQAQGWCSFGSRCFFLHQ